jgi:ribosomal protein S24E
MPRIVDNRKIEKIKQVLNKNPEGIWVREIARQANLDKSTVSIYLNKHMKSCIESVYPIKNNLIKIVRMKK